MATRKSTRARKVTKVIEERADEDEVFEAEEDVIEEDEDEEDDEVSEKKGKKRAASTPKKAPAAKKAKGKEKDVSTATAPAVATDFTIPPKEPNQLKIASWNIAGFKAIMKKGLLEYITAEDPDIICLQETKIEEELALKHKLPEAYHAYFYASKTKKGYSGTGLLSKIKPISVTKGIGLAEHDDEGRCITAEYEKFYLVTTYVPNSGAVLANLGYRVERWDVDFLKYLKKLEETKPVIWCGDLNVAHLEIDLKNPKTNTKTAGFTKEERESFTKLLGSGFVDTFRHFNPTLEGAYTFWSYKAGARAKDVGWRLDYFIVSQSFLPSVASTHIRKHVAGSDHCPIILLVNN